MKIADFDKGTLNTSYYVKFKLLNELTIQSYESTPYVAAD